MQLPMFFCGDVCHTMGEDWGAVAMVVIINGEVISCHNEWDFIG